MFVKDKTKHDGYRPSCKECRKTSGYDEKFRGKHRDRLANYHRQYREDNRERTNEICKEYRARDRDKSRLIVKNAKHKRRQVEKKSKLTGLELKNWSDSQLKLCSYCGYECSNNYHIDHIIPLCDGGEHELHNLTIACSSCNKKKNRSGMIVFMAQRHTVNLAMLRGA